MLYKTRHIRHDHGKGPNISTGGSIIRRCVADRKRKSEVGRGEEKTDDGRMRDTDNVALIKSEIMLS